MFKLEFVHEIYNKALDSGMVSDITLYAQLSCGFWVMFVMLNRFMTSRKDSIDDSNKLKPSDFTRPIVIMILIFTYPYLLDILDWFAVAIEKKIMDFSPNAPGYATSQEDYLKLTSQEAEDIEDLGVFQMLIYYVSRMYNYLTHPGVWIMDSFRSVFVAIDALIFGIALISRAIKMFMLRVVGSFAILASMYHRFDGYAANWARLYVLNYLYVAFLFVINYFSEFVYYEIREAKLQGVEDEFGYVSSLAYLVMLIVKIGLYRKSYTFLKEVFSNA